MKKFENIVIASDLDGTYFGSKQYIIERNCNAVRYFCENGGHFTFATGRLPQLLKKPVPNPEKHVNMPAVLGNGGCIYDYQKGYATEEHFVNAELIKEIVNFVGNIDGSVGFRSVSPEGIIVPNLENGYVRREFEGIPACVNKMIIPTAEWGRYNLYKTNIMCEPGSVGELYEILRSRYGDELGITRSGPFIVELMPKGVNKAEALKKLVDKFFGRPMTLCCVGDYDNDIEMLEMADISACPSNAIDKVKEICDLNLCSNDDGVIGDLVEYLDKNLQKNYRKKGLSQN